jgi:hypothetical protein
MSSNSSHTEKEREKEEEKEQEEGSGFATIFSCAVGGGLWTFIASNPSPVAWIISILLLSYLVLGYCLMEICLMESSIEGNPIKVQTQTLPPLRLEI